LDQDRRLNQKDTAIAKLNKKNTELEDRLVRIEVMLSSTKGGAR